MDKSDKNDRQTETILIALDQLNQTIDVMMAQNRGMLEVPEVVRAVGKAGRADTALDPAPAEVVVIDNASADGSAELAVARADDGIRAAERGPIAPNLLGRMVARVRTPNS